MIDMEKNEIFLKVENTPLDYSIDSDIIISAWTSRNANMMLDEHIVESFPELNELEMGDLSEGEIEYWGQLNVDQLKEKLFDLGFNII